MKFCIHWHFRIQHCDLPILVHLRNNLDTYHRNIFYDHVYWAVEIAVWTCPLSNNYDNLFLRRNHLQAMHHDRWDWGNIHFEWEVDWSKGAMSFLAIWWERLMEIPMLNCPKKLRLKIAKFAHSRSSGSDGEQSERFVLEITVRIPLHFSPNNGYIQGVWVG